ncbi:MAG: hypothetical protein KDI55_00155 [Anaerolineae bacterium]|nr:hypothetical protein [Anaerolineae bacterium]
MVKESRRLLHELSQPWNPRSVQWRIQYGEKNDRNQFKVVPYIDARQVQDRFDTVCGTGWKAEFTEFGSGIVCCTISIHTENGWVSRSDGGPGMPEYPPIAYSSDPKDGAANRKMFSRRSAEMDTDSKGAFSNAFKRAATMWGVGRYIYLARSHYIPGSSISPDDRERLARSLFDQFGLPKPFGQSHEVEAPSTSRAAAPQSKSANGAAHPPKSPPQQTQSKPAAAPPPPPPPSSPPPQDTPSTPADDGHQEGAEPNYGDSVDFGDDHGGLDDTGYDHETGEVLDTSGPPDDAFPGDAPAKQPVSQEDTYRRIVTDINTCMAMQDLQETWLHFQKDMMSMPDNWKAELVNVKDARKASINKMNTAGAPAA